MGADTRQASADERVAPKIPALMSGAKADTRLIDWTHESSVHFHHLCSLTLGLDYSGRITLAGFLFA